jgi:hypothetical protein
MALGAPLAHPQAKLSRGWRSGAALVITWALACSALGCEEKREPKKAVAASPGISQASADGPLVDEDKACEQFRNALTGIVDDLSCSDVEVPACPELIRPAGSAACNRFSQGSLDECIEQIAKYETCDDLTFRRCVLVADLSAKTEGCVVPGTVIDAGGDGPSTPASGDASTPPTSDAGASEAADARAPETASDSGPRSTVVDGGSMAQPEQDASITAASDAGRQSDGGNPATPDSGASSDLDSGSASATDAAADAAP